MPVVWPWANHIKITGVAVRCRAVNTAHFNFYVGHHVYCHVCHAKSQFGLITQIGVTRVLYHP